MKYSVEMVSHKDWFRHSEFQREDTEAHTQHGDLISLLPFSQRKEIRLTHMKNLL
jgi:hypothetical protein